MKSGKQNKAAFLKPRAQWLFQQLAACRAGLHRKPTKALQRLDATRLRHSDTVRIAFQIEVES